MLDKTTAIHRVAPTLSKASKELKAFTAWFVHHTDEARKAGTMHSAKHTVTPEMAAWLIANFNKGNRPLGKKRLDNLKRILSAGRWRLTSQGFSFSNENPPRINNGQHRLRAIIDTGVEVEVLFTFGEPRDVFAVLDDGGRNLTDAVAIQFTHLAKRDVTVLTDAAQLVHRIVDRDIAQTYKPDDVLGIIDLFPELQSEQLQAAARHAASKIKGWGTQMAFLAAFVLILRKTKGTKERVEVASVIKTFAEKMATGANEPARSPLLALRDALKDGTIGEEYKGRFRAACLCAGIAIAWRLWVDGRTGGARLIKQWVPNDPFPFDAE